MSTGLLEQRANFPRSQYEYGLGGHGTADANNNGRKEIDCSNLLNRMLKSAGYEIPYKSTAQLATDTTHFDVVHLLDVEGGDIALWVTRGHTGVVEDIDINRVSGNFFGSQTSTGPKSTKFGLNSNYWPMPDTFLRPKPRYRNGAQSVPEPAAAPEAPATASTAQPINFQYPIRQVDGKQFIDAEEVYKALEAETSGHYLLGSNKFWHGGIHITDNSAPQCVLNEPVCCVADGEVVAYRLNEDYLESTFGDNENKLKYSNSFCLVRHEYKSAPNPEDGPNKGKQNTLNFYSLYMHLLPYNRYPLSESEKPTPKVTMTVNDFRAYDVFPEVSGTPSPGQLSTGTKLEVLEQKTVGNVTYARGKILSGAVKNGARKAREAGAEVWFAYLKEGVPYQNSERKNIWKADKIVERLRPNYWQGKVNATAVNKLNLYQGPVAPQHGQLVGPRFGTMQLIPGSVVEFDSRDVLNLRLNGFTRKMAKCTKISGDLAGAGTAPSVFWACVENQRDYRILDWTSLTPTSFNTVEMASTGIKAGDPIGYLGLTENLTGEDGGVVSKYQVHVEIFTTEDGVKDFLRNVAGLKSGKQYAHIAAGIELKQKSPATDVTLLKNQHAVDLSKATVIMDGAEDWYEVSVIDDGQSVSGLVKKAEADIVTQHDWEKLGFQIVEENNATADGFLDPEDTPQFFKDIFAKIDANHDGELGPGELAVALKSAEIRNQWTKLIAHHPTEWRHKADAAKWSKLDQLLEASPKTLKHEKERISEYVFWDELTGKAVMGTDVIWHFHPVEFIDVMLGKQRLATCRSCGKNITLTLDVMKKIVTNGVSDVFLGGFVSKANALFPKYGVDTCSQVVHLLGQGKHETQRFTAFRESLNYSRRSYNAERLYRMARTAIDGGFTRLAMNLTRDQKIAYIDRHLIANDSNYGKHSFGSLQYPNNDYRGRGLLHLTHYSNYLACATDIGINIVADPTLVEVDTGVMIETGLWYWKANNIGALADNSGLAMDAKVRAVTAKINTGLKGLEERLGFTKDVSAVFKSEFGSCSE